MLLSFIRTVVLYLILVAVIRLMGKRQIGQLEPAEFVVTMLVANLASIPMQDAGIPLLSGLVPILTVLGVELVLSGLALRSIRFRKMLCGKPVILIDNGRVIQENLRRTRITQDELTGHLREKDVLDLTQVRYAILETDGNISVFPFPGDGSLPTVLVSDGVVLEENLALSGHDRSWLRRVLEERHAGAADTWYLSVDADGGVRFIRKEGKA